MIKRVDPPPDERPIPGEGRLRRWSRLKEEARTEEKTKSPPVAEPEKSAALTPSAPSGAAAESPGKGKDDPAKDLPPLESLTKDSDYSPFMREGVPEDLRAEALRKLWGSDPLFREPFAFEIHMEDYNATFRPLDALKDTIYKTGRGYLSPEEIAAQAGEDIPRKTQGAEPVAPEKVGEEQATAVSESGVSAAAAVEAESSPTNSSFPDTKEGLAPNAFDGAVDKSEKST